MGNIYAGATLTLIAAGDADHTVGLPGVSNCRYSSGAEFQLGPYSFVRLLSDPKAEIESSKWATRGWAYQEAMLSVRKLVFRPNGFYTQCNIQHSFGSSHPISGQTIIWSRENIDTYVDHDFELRSQNATTVVFSGSYSDELELRSKTVIDEFFDHISEYMRRHLSYESDRLNAIQGVLNEFRSNKEPLYQIFGVPFNPASEWTINTTLFWCMRNHSVQRRADFPSWSWLGWQHVGKIPDQFILLWGFKDLNTRGRFSRYLYPSDPWLSLDRHSARISVEFLGGGLLNLTGAHESSIALDVALPREARIMPHLVIHGVIIPSVFEGDGHDWVRVGARWKPFHRKFSLFPFKFRMWLDVPDVQEEDGFLGNQVRELILGRFGAVIRVLILRQNGTAWTRIGIGQYGWETSVTNATPWDYGIETVENVYLEVLKNHQKRTIWLM